MAAEDHSWDLNDFAGVTRLVGLLAAVDACDDEKLLIICLLGNLLSLFLMLYSSSLVILPEPSNTSGLSFFRRKEW